MKWFALLIALTSISRAEQNEFQVELNPQLYPVGEFAGKGIKTGKIPPRVKRPDAMPEKSERELVFSKVRGLEENIANWDELDRDILFVRAKNRTLKELRQFYPAIPEKKLHRLQSELRDN